MNYRFMIVDDEQNIVDALTRILRKRKDWEIETYTSASQALKRARSASFELFIADYCMPEMNGVEFLARTKELRPDAIRIILSGHANLDALMAAINQAEIYRYICKPWHHHDITTTIDQALLHYNILVENRCLADQVRRQQKELDKRKAAIDKLREYSTKLVNVDWSADGSIMLNDADLENLELALGAD